MCCPRPPWRRQVHVVLVGLIHHRHHPDPPLPGLPCNIEAKAQSVSLTNWHVACCIKCARHKQWAHWAVRFEVLPGVVRLIVEGLREKPYGKSDTDYQQQELFVVVAARLAADQVLRARVR
jgi:hypothetical protein